MIVKRAFSVFVSPSIEETQKSDFLLYKGAKQNQKKNMKISVDNTYQFDYTKRVPNNTHRKGEHTHGEQCNFTSTSNRRT